MIAQKEVYALLAGLGEQKTRETVEKEVKSTRGLILDKAKEIINGQRQDAYGSPEDSFSKIASLWSTYKGHKYTSHDVAMMMVLLKVARISTGLGGEDSYIDLCGYTALAVETGETEKTEKTNENN